MRYQSLTRIKSILGVNITLPMIVNAHFNRVATPQLVLRLLERMREEGVELECRPETCTYFSNIVNLQK